MGRPEVHVHGKSFPLKSLECRWRLATALAMVAGLAAGGTPTPRTTRAVGCIISP